MKFVSKSGEKRYSVFGEKEYEYGSVLFGEKEKYFLVYMRDLQWEWNKI